MDLLAALSPEILPSQLFPGAACEDWAGSKYHIKTRQHKVLNYLRAWFIVSKTQYIGRMWVLLWFVVFCCWMHYDMMTSSNGNIFRVIGLLCGEFTGHRWIPCTKASDAGLWRFFDLGLNKRLSKKSWFETPSRSLWRQCNGTHDITATTQSITNPSVIL